MQVINLRSSKFDKIYMRSTTLLVFAQIVSLVFLITNEFTYFTSGNFNVLIFLAIFFYKLYSSKYISAFLFLFTFFMTTLIVTQITTLLGFDSYSQMIFLLCVFLSYLIAGKVDYDVTSLGKLFLVIHSTFFLLVPYSIFKLQGLSSNLATFISGWDHTGGHFYIIKTIKESGTYSYFPADYIGANPKLFHAFISFFVSKPISAVNDFMVILFFEFFLTYIISLCVVTMIFQNRQGSFAPGDDFANKLPLLIAGVIPFFGFYLGWIVGYGYPTVLFTLATVLTAIIVLRRFVHSTIIMRVLLISLIVIIGNSWNPALPGAITALIYFHVRFVKRIRYLLLDLSLGVLGVFPAAFSLYLNSGTNAASVGSVSNSQILIVFLAIGLILSLYFLVTGVFIQQHVLAAFALGNLLFAGLIKLMSKANVFEVPYYSVKLLWLSSIPLVLCLTLNIPLQRNNKKVSRSPLSIGLLLSTLFLSNVIGIFPGGEKAISLFKPSQYELLWQSRVLLYVNDFSDSQPYIAFSGSVWDSRSAQFSSILGRNTWNAINGLQIDTDAMCRFILANNSTLVITRESVSLPNCISKSKIVYFK